MNIQQLQYIVAVDEHRHFQKAADACFITPATLSMMIKKLEQELNLIIFDRSKHPISPTDLGIPIIEKAKTILYHIKDLEHSAQYSTEEIAGEVRIAIIPTLAPYLSYLFLPSLLKKYPKLKIKLYEWNTEQITDALKHNRLDIGIAATPLHISEITETPIFYEKLVAYTEEISSTLPKTYIAPEDINLKRLWLLEEDHCLRSQVINLCSLKKKHEENLQIDFEAGSIETLLNIVGINEGITIIPELVVHTLTEQRKKKIRQFTDPAPVREISLLTYRYYSKEKILEVLREEIQNAIKPHLTSTTTPTKIIEITN